MNQQLKNTFVKRSKKNYTAELLSGLLPMGRIYFVETKAPGKDLRKLQKFVRGLIQDLGFIVLRIDTKEKVNIFIREVQSNGIQTTQLSGVLHSEDC